MNKIIRNVFFVGAAYAAYENICSLSVRREELGGDIKAVQISDLHKRSFGKNNSRLIGKVADERPDVIFITGDLVSRDETDLMKAKKLVEKLCRVAPVYMIYGNHEKSLPMRKYLELGCMLRNTDVILLQNESSVFTKNGRKIVIYGLSEKYSTYKKNDSYRDLDKLNKAELESLIGKCPEGEDVILLAHNPLFGSAYAEWGAEKTFSGHVHGGAVRLFGKGILSPERKFFPKYSKGIYTIGKMKLLVSAGLGKLRLFDPPEIVVYYI